MNSSEEFKIMKDFAYYLSDRAFRDRILKMLNKQNPFQNFKALIDSSVYREEWFKFKDKAYFDFVKKQIASK